MRTDAIHRTGLCQWIHAVALATVCAACSPAASPVIPPPPSSPVVTEIDLFGPDTVIAIGTSYQLRLVALDASNHLTTPPAATWTSAQPLTATVSATGLVTALTVGSATITVVSAGFTRTAVVRVGAGPAASLVINVLTSGLAVGSNVVVGVRARDQYGNFFVPPSVAWTSSDPTVATISADGLLTTFKAGTTTISARLGTLLASATVVVTDSLTVTSLQLSGISSPLLLGATAILTVSGRNAQGGYLGAQLATWSTSDPQVVAITTPGPAASAGLSALGVGTATIVARVGGLVAQFVVTVAGTGAANFVVTTTGTNPDNQYFITVYTSCSYYSYYCAAVWQGTVPGNGTVSVPLAANSYTYSVSDIARNCSGPASGSFDVISQRVTTVALAYTCVPTGTVAVSVQAGGVDVQTSYTILVDGSYGSGVNAGSAASIELPAGTHSIALTNLNSNCTVTGPNSFSATVIASATTNVGFTVTCVANPVLRVTVTTTGSHVPVSYVVGVDDDYYYGYVYASTIPSTGTVSFSLPTGGHIVGLSQVPLNCTVTSPNNVSLNLLLGSTTNLDFTVSCQ